MEKTLEELKKVKDEAWAVYQKADEEYRKRRSRDIVGKIYDAYIGKYVYDDGQDIYLHIHKVECLDNSNFITIIGDAIDFADDTYIGFMAGYDIRRSKTKFDDETGLCPEMTFITKEAFDEKLLNGIKGVQQVFMTDKEETE